MVNLWAKGNQMHVNSTFKGQNKVCVFKCCNLNKYSLLQCMEAIPTNWNSKTTSQTFGRRGMVKLQTWETRFRHSCNLYSPRLHESQKIKMFTLSSKTTIVQYMTLKNVLLQGGGLDCCVPARNFDKVSTSITL